MVRKLTLLMVCWVGWISPLVAEINQPPTPILKDTNLIGTLLQPTIDGGQINKARAPRGAKTPRIDGFDDSWAISPALENALNRAISSGKFKTVLSAIQVKKMPSSLAFIPLVESGYQSNAISPKGAAGPWQLMPAVANDYGISSQARHEWTSSTEVALQLLSDLHHRFGNWELALAAYNAGSTRVLNALHQQPHQQQLEKLPLPLETKRYVATIKALSQRFEQELMSVEVLL